MPSIFKKIREYFIGQSEVEVYGGQKGGYSYLIIYDKTKKEIIGQHVNPPKKIYKNLNTGFKGYGLDIGINYQATVDQTDPFTIINKNKTSPISIEEVTNRMNEFRTSINEPEIKIKEVYEMNSKSSYIAGNYVVPVSPHNLESPFLQSHFEVIEKGLENSLTMFLEFVINSFWGAQKNFRSCIFLHNGLNSDLKMHVAYNMSGSRDYKINLKDGTGVVGRCMLEMKPIIADFNILKHQDLGVDPERIWEDLKSILAIPILDTENIPLGVLSVDSDQTYTDSKFNNKDINNGLQILTRGIGQIISGCSP